MESSLRRQSATTTNIQTPDKWQPFLEICYLDIPALLILLRTA